MSTIGQFETLKPIELDWYADGDVIRVTPRNQQRFDIQKDRAVEILQRAKEAALFNQQFALLLSRLAQWVTTQEEKVARAIVTLHDGILGFVVVQKSKRYDPALQDALLDVDFEIANDPDLDLIQLETIVLPLVGDEALMSFVDPRLMLEYHGKRS